VGLGLVVPLAETGHARRARGAARVRDEVIELATGGLAAPGDAAREVTGEQEVAARLWRPVDGPAEVQQVTGDRIDDEPVPGGVRGEHASDRRGDESVAEKIGRGLREACQGGQVRDEPHLYAPPVRRREIAVAPACSSRDKPRSLASVEHMFES
jgi:hypothetical protein